MVELIGKYLEVVFPLLGAVEREKIERAILCIQTDDPEEADFITRCQNRLLGCLPASEVVSSEAKARLRELASAGGPPPNTPLFEMGEVIGEEYSEARWLEDQGVKMESEPNRRLYTISKSTAQFSNQFMNEAPTLEQVNTVISAIGELHQLLASGGDGADSRVVTSAWTHLAAACAAIAGAEWLESNEEVSDFIRAVLLEASRHEDPRPNAERDQHYEEHGGISPSPRWHAAGGILDLARFPTLATPEVIGAVQRLSNDPCAEVRSEVARHIAALYRTAPEAFWQLLKRVESAEGSRRIIHYTLCGVRHFARQHPNDMLEIARRVFNRFRNASDASEIRCECLSIVISANSGGEQPYGDGLINTVICDMATFTAEAVHLVQTAASLLTKGPVDPPDPRWDRLRLASFTFLHGIARAVQEWLRNLETKLQGVHRANWPEDVLKAARQVGHEPGQRTYFASGAFDENMEQRRNPQRQLTAELKRRFFREASSLLSLIVELGFPEVLHNALETYSAYVTTDPREVFLAVARAVHHGQSGGYQFESLAANLVVGLVRRYIADYRTLFRKDSYCLDALIEILNIFVRAGWPEAIDLTCRLEEVFR